MEKVSMRDVIIMLLAGAGLLHWVDFILGVIYPAAVTL
jgi:hypothetical protein